MRLMLGHKTTPELLVYVSVGYNPSKFDFYVINGCWNGVFTNGHITILGCPSGDHTRIDVILEILCDNQDRLRGDYNDVFNNYSNVNYASPADKIVDMIDMDDDIPF